VPDGWSFKESRDAKNGLQTAMLGDASGEIVLQISFFPDAANKFGTKAAIEAEIRRDFTDMLEGAVERELRVVTTETAGGFESHAVFTDRRFAKGEVPPSERRMATPGLRSMPGAFIVFTLLSNQTDSAAYKTALDVVRGLRIDAPPPRTDDVVVSERDGAYELTVPVSRLAVTIPKEGFTRRTDRGSSSSRYFYFEDAARHLFVSGWFEPESEFQGVKKFWESETAAWAKNNMPAAEDVVFRKIGGWETIAYRSAKGPHLRAHWISAGTWIDLHLSGPDAATLESLLGRIRVSEKP